MTDLSWLWTNWRSFGVPFWVNPALILMAVIFGIILGGERQRREKPAGLRTMTMVCLGSAIFTMVSFTFSTTTGDSGRVAAQIVTGIGFLGAGVILHGKRVVSGMTTAASIWVAAAIGMAVGAGYAGSALLLSILVNRMLVLFFLYETRWHPDLQSICVVLEYAPRGGITRMRLERVLVDYNLRTAFADWTDPSDQQSRMSLKVRLARVHLYELLAELADVPDVVAIRQESCPVHQARSPL